MRTHRSPHRRAVTLVEVLVTVGVTVILTLILITGLRAVRGQTLAMKDLQNLRLSGQDMLLWSMDNDEKFLNFESPQSALYRAVHASVPNPSLSFYLSLYFGQSLNWPHYLKASLGETREHWQTAYKPENWAVPNSPAGSGPAPPRQHFIYTPTVLSDTAMWVDPPVTSSVTECGPYIKTVRRSLAAHPSRKGLLIHYDIPDTPDHSHVVFVDGSASGMLTSSLRPPIPHPHSRAGAPGRPVLHTKDGYLGVDQ